MSLIINHLFKKNGLTICNQLKSTSGKSNQELILNLNKHLCPFVQNQDVRYAGHSKWQNIRHTKASKDSIKSKKYNRISLSITKAALNGTDPKLNKELANLLDECRRENISRDLIDRAIKRSQTQRIVTGSKGFIGPNNVIGIANFLYDPRFTRPSTFLRNVNKNYKEYKFVDTKMLLSFFDRKGLILIYKYDKNSKPVPFEQVEEVAIESEAEEVEITCDEDKEIPPLPEVVDESNVKASKRVAQKLEDDEIDFAFYWKLVVSEEGLYTAKGIIEKSYPDLVIKEATVEYFAKESVSLNEKDLDLFTRFCDELSDVEEFDKVYSNVN